MSCKKCSEKIGIMIEENGIIYCIRCHPSAISNLLSSKDNFEKMKNLNFNNVAKRKFE